MKPAVEYDRVANAAHIRFSKEGVLESAQVDESIILDYDAQGWIVGIEVLDARAHLAPPTLDEAT
ncbi:MAG: DUF2283 domain-containing protein [Rhizobium sp.]